MTARLLTEDGCIEISDARAEQCLALVTALDEFDAEAKRARRHGHMSEAKDRCIWRLRESGCSDGAIADALGVTVNQVRGAIKRCKNGRYSWAGEL